MAADPEKRKRINDDFKKQVDKMKIERDRQKAKERQTRDETKKVGRKPLPKAPKTNRRKVVEDDGF